MALQGGEGDDQVMWEGSGVCLCVCVSGCVCVCVRARTFACCFLFTRFRVAANQQKMVDGRQSALYLLSPLAIADS